MTNFDIENFKKENEKWLSLVIDDYTKEVTCFDGETSYSHGFFSDMPYFLAFKLRELGIKYTDEDLNTLHDWIENKIVDTLG